MKSAQTSVGLAAAAIVDGTNGTSYDPVIVNLKTSSGAIFIGGADVSSSKGYVVGTTETQVQLSGEDLYAVATATATVQLFYNER